MLRLAEFVLPLPSLGLSLLKLLQLLLELGFLLSHSCLSSTASTSRIPVNLDTVQVVEGDKV
jgi:hypothetical protein